MVLQFRLKTVWKISKPYCLTLKQWLGSFAWKVIVCTTKIRDETFRNGKRYEGVSSLPLPTHTHTHSMGELFSRKSFAWVKKSFGANLWGGVYVGTNDQIMQGWNLMVNRFQRRVKLVLLSLTLTWLINILFEKLTPQIGDWIWKTHSAYYASEFGISCKACLLF